MALPEEAGEWPPPIRVEARVEVRCGEHEGEFAVVEFEMDP